MTPARILIVEDESVIAFDLEMQLANLGYQVAGLLASGEQAVIKAGELQPDIVLMDIHLEGAMDGIEAAREIHEKFRIPVVFLTAYAEDSMLERAETSRPYGYLIKPCNSREMHASLQMALARRAAVAEVEAREDRLRLAMESAGLGIWEYDGQSGRVRVDGHFYDVLEQYPEGKENLETLWSRAHDQDRPGLETALLRSAAEETQVHRVFRHLRHDGRSAWIEIHAKSYSMTPGKVTQINGIVRDITEQRENEDLLRAAAAAFDTATDGIFITDPAHHIIAVNPAFQSMTGYDETEVIGANANALLFQEAPSADFYTRIASLPRGQWQGELHCLMKDQQPFLAWINISLVRGMNGMTIRYVGSMTDITALRKAETKLTHLAFYDSVTGLPNRQLFNDRLEQTLAKERRDQVGGTLMFIDLDGFKDINDRFGHANGDQLLRIMGERLKRSLRAGDTVARFGGDEFLVLLADIRQPSDAATVARKLLESLIQPLDIAGLGMSISASIGIALYPADGTESHLLLQAADTALNRAKAQEGRGRFCFHTPAWLSDSTLQ